jgi:hypothetical protein
MLLEMPKIRLNYSSLNVFDDGVDAIYNLDFIHRPYVSQPRCFKVWFFPRHHLKPTLLGPVDRASLYRQLVCPRQN